ncbi:MAG: DUF1643 domain-containing protein [Chitinivibrionia bacterium]|nr:DUF1643 domain-containing protein [Chitinivibrionia bacterium]
MNKKYEINEKDGDKVRYVLGNRSNNPLFAIGLNCSTATDEKSDPTLSRIEKLAEKNGFGSFIMLNLYPLRSTKPKNLPTADNDDLIVKNAEVIEKFLKDYSKLSVLACWGANIKKKKYLSKSLNLLLEKMKDKEIDWKAIKLTESKHPHHPIGTSCGELIGFDVEKYIKELGGSK